MTDTTHDDLVQAAVAAALKEAAHAIDCGCDPQRGGCANIDFCPKHEVNTILALIPEGAQAALDRVVAAALREAAQAARLSISEREEWPPKDGDVLVDDCMAAILDLIPEGEE